MLIKHNINRKFVTLFVGLSARKRWLREIRCKEHANNFALPVQYRAIHRNNHIKSCPVTSATTGPVEREPTESDDRPIWNRPVRRKSIVRPVIG